MLKHSASFYVLLGQLFERLAGDLRFDRFIGGVTEKLAALPTPVNLNVKTNDPPPTPEQMRDHITTIAQMTEGLALPVTASIMKRHINSPPKTEEAIQGLMDVFVAELKSYLFLFVPQHVAQYYEWDEIVSQKVVGAFPLASEEIRSAGTCLAAGLHTACVFHAMRAAEIGVRVLGTKLNITLPGPIEQAEWQQILNAIVPKIRDIENLPKTTPGRDEDLQFYSEAAAQFRFFKNGWRIRVMHARATYNEPQAKEALEHVRSFFETLAERLSEAQAS
jgi:hypothetical protein